MPKPNSALSSKRELAQAGPSPLELTVYGKDGLEPPQIDEQPEHSNARLQPRKATARQLDFAGHPARGVGDDESVTEKLGHQFHMRRLAAALACSAKLKIRLLEL